MSRIDKSREEKVDEWLPRMRGGRSCVKGKREVTAKVKALQVGNEVF